MSPKSSLNGCNWVDKLLYFTFLQYNCYVLATCRIFTDTKKSSMFITTSNGPLKLQMYMLKLFCVLYFLLSQNELFYPNAGRILQKCLYTRYLNTKKLYFPNLRWVERHKNFTIIFILTLPFF